MSDQLFSTPDAAGPDAAVDPNAPLPARMRPHTLDEIVGQEHVLGEGSALRRAIEHGRPFSMVLYGPPGTGKTTLARIVAASADAAFEELSATAAGKAEVRAVIERASVRRKGGRGTVFFLDEIHRFNKAQQDALLPAVEEGLVTLIGATTENPYFEVNSALLSRAQVIELHALTATDVEVLQRRAVLYDKGGDQHYDVISAWIKATRGSDPDASLYYLAVMLEGGEDARYIARRMVILASEDVGNADPGALAIAVAAADAVEHVGLPEAQFALAQAAIYLSLAPKSDAAKRAIGAARGHVRDHGAQTPPAPLRDNSYAGAAALGRGQGYDYPHARPGHVSPQELMPETVAGQRFYAPDDAEAALAERLAEIRRARGVGGD
jgi:putative ATPase